MNKIDKHIFSRCTTPAQCIPYISKYAKDHGGTIAQVCWAIGRRYGIFVDADMVARYRNHTVVPIWATDSRKCAEVTVTKESDMNFLVVQLVGVV